MTEDFALLDFALVAAPPAQVAVALDQARSSHASRRTEAAESNEKQGFMARMLKRRGAVAGRVAPLLIQPPSTLGPAPLGQPTLDPVAPDLFRLSGPVGVGGLTLIEMNESLGEDVTICAELSAILSGIEVFFFRYSGGAHPGAEFAFHVYEDGRLVRRVSSMSPLGTAFEAPWTAVETGMTHPLEADSLTRPETPRAEIMTPQRQASILEALGVEPDTLFDDMNNRQIVLVLSPAPGGRPLSEAALHDGTGLRGPAQFDPTESALDDKAIQTTAPVRPIDMASVSASTEAQPDPGFDDPSSGWEDQVTSLLVAAVEAALPEAEQVPWLDRLTKKLESGEIGEALIDAQSLIARGDRPADERHAASQRLFALFGRSAPRDSASTGNLQR